MIRELLKTKAQLRLDEITRSITVHSSKYDTERDVTRKTCEGLVADGQLEVVGHFRRIGIFARVAAAE